MTAVKVVLLSIGILYVIFPNAVYLSFSYIIVFIIYLLHLQWLIRDIATKKFLRPRLRNTRVSIIITVMLTIILLLYARLFWWFTQFDFSDLGIDTPSEISFPNFWSSFSPIANNSVPSIPLFSLVAGASLLINLFIDLTLPLWVLILVLFTDPLSVLSRLRIIKQAEKIIRDRGDSLKIVAVTGSYGKTTTKEIIYEILSRKYKTSKTPQNQNTAVGVAKAIIDNVKKDTEVFIAEMGAYKKGEISRAVKIAPPDISLVTALSQQHVSLFGSLDNLFAAKYEIIEGLKESGVAVLNGNDDGCIRMADMTNRTKMMFYHKVPSEANPSNIMSGDGRNESIVAKKIAEDGDRLLIEFEYKSKIFSLNVGFKDRRMALNLLAAIGVCLQLGMTVEEIVSIINNFNYSGNYLKEYKSINESIAIDDGKSANYDGFQMALSYLSKKAAKSKWIMTQGIIELGTERERIYSKLAKEIVVKSDGLITNDKVLAQHVRSAKADYKIVFIKDSNLFPTYFSSVIKKGDIVLIEGTFAQSILEKIVIDGD